MDGFFGWFLIQVLTVIGIPQAVFILRASSPQSSRGNAFIRHPKPKKLEPVLITILQMGIKRLNNLLSSAQLIKGTVCMRAEWLQPCLTLCDPMDCSPAEWRSNLCLYDFKPQLLPSKLSLSPSRMNKPQNGMRWSQIAECWEELTASGCSVKARMTMARFFHDDSRPKVRAPRRTDLEQSRQCLHSQEKSVLSGGGHGVGGAGPWGRGGSRGEVRRFKAETRLKTKGGWARKHTGLS